MAELVLIAQLAVEREQLVPLLRRQRPAIGTLGEVPKCLEVARFGCEPVALDPADQGGHARRSTSRWPSDRLLDLLCYLDLPRLGQIGFAELLDLGGGDRVLVFGTGEVECRLAA